MDSALRVGQGNDCRPASGGRRRPTVASVSSAILLDLDWPAPEYWTGKHYSQLSDELEARARGEGTKGIILTGPSLFSSPAWAEASGIDTAFDALLRQIADSPLPVVAVLPSSARGRGLELAIACAARVAGRSAVLSLSGVHAGELPSFETLRKLPHLVAIEPASRMVALGWSIDGIVGKSLGLIDVIDEDDLLAAARGLLDQWQTPSRISQATPDPLEVTAKFFVVRRMMRREAPNQIAAHAAITALETAVLKRKRAAETEVNRIAMDLAESPQGMALRYAAEARESLSANTLEAERRGSLAQRLWWPMAREAIHLLDEGARPAQIDKCFADFGFSIGPFSKADARGFAEVFTPTAGALAAGADWVLYSPTLDLMADSGRTGGGRPGWYAPTTTGIVNHFDPAVDRLIQSSAISQRLRRTPLSDETVMTRCLNAGVNASFALLAENQDLQAVDVEAIWLSCLEFPKWRGGMIYHARNRGLGTVIAALSADAAQRNTAGLPCQFLVSAASA